MRRGGGWTNWRSSTEDRLRNHQGWDVGRSRVSPRDILAFQHDSCCESLDPIESTQLSRRRSEELMKNLEYQICTNCIMDTSDSKIRFDARGLCDYCRNFYARILPNWHPNNRGEDLL